ncbi:MAG: hypothetical protein ACRCX2_14095 [Paraclostridium sp.]
MIREIDLNDYGLVAVKVSVYKYKILSCDLNWTYVGKDIDEKELKILTNNCIDNDKKVVVL